MRWTKKDWQPVPFAWFPQTYEGVTYWMERPPYERKHVGMHVWCDEFAFRRSGETKERWREWF